MSGLTHFTIYGERCSGTNYLESLILENFNIELTWKYGWKHFFGFHNLSNSDNTLFICIVRNPVDWLNSLYRDKWHIEHYKSLRDFFTKEFYSTTNIYRKNGELTNQLKYGILTKIGNPIIIYNKKKKLEIMEDRNIFTKKRYCNIFEMRKNKLKFMIDVLPLKVKHYILVKYEDLISNFDEEISRIANCGLQIKNKDSFPKNIFYYKKNKNKLFKNNKPSKKIPESLIFENPNYKKHFDRQLGYIHVKSVSNN